MYEKNIEDISGFLNEYEHLRGYLGSNKVLRKDIKSIIIRKNNIKITLIDGKLCSFSNKKFKRNVKKDFDKILKKYSITEEMPINGALEFFNKYRNDICDGVKSYFKDNFEDEFVLNFRETEKAVVIGIKYKENILNYDISYANLNDPKCKDGENFSRPRIKTFIISKLCIFINNIIEKYWDKDEELKKLENKIFKNITSLLNIFYNDKYAFLIEGDFIIIKYNDIKYNTNIRILDFINIDNLCKVNKYPDETGIIYYIYELTLKNNEYFDFIFNITNQVKKQLDKVKLLITYKDYDEINEVIGESFKLYRDNALIIFNGIQKAKIKNKKVYAYFNDLDTIYIENELQTIKYNLKTKDKMCIYSEQYESLLKLINSQEHRECFDFFKEMINSNSYSFSYRKGKGILFGDLEVNITDKISGYNIIKQIKIAPYTNSVILWKREIVKLFKDLDIRFKKYDEVLRLDFLDKNSNIKDNFLVLDILGLLKQNSLAKDDIINIFKGRCKVGNLNYDNYFGKYTLLSDDEILKTLDILEKKKIIENFDGKFIIKDLHYYDYLNPNISSLTLELNDKIQNEEILTDTESLYMLNNILKKQSLTLKDYINIFSLFNNIRFTSRYLTDILSIFKLAPTRLKNKDEAESLTSFLKMNLCADIDINKKKVIQKILYSDKEN